MTEEKGETLRAANALRFSRAHEIPNNQKPQSAKGDFKKWPVQGVGLQPLVRRGLTGKTTCFNLITLIIISPLYRAYNFQPIQLPAAI
jgi:hypothetical protein